MMTDIETIGRATGLILLYIVAGFLLVGVFWLVQDKITPFTDKEERARGNVAVWVQRIGGSTGILIASAGSLIMSDGPLWANLGMFLLDGVCAIVVFSIAMVLIFDPVVLPGIKNTLEIQRGNGAVGLFEAFGFLAMGCIMCGSFAGSDPDLLTGQINGLLWGLIGAVTLMVAFLLYSLVWLFLRACGINKQIAEGNTAAAVDAGTLLFAMSIVVMFSIMGDSANSVQDLASYTRSLVGELTLFARGLAAGVLAVFTARILAGIFARRMGSTTREKHHGNVLKSLMVGIPSIISALSAGLIIVGS